MMHENRRFCLSPVATADQLARMLTQHIWTLCTGFFVTTHPHYLFLNDSTSPDGAQEYAIVRRSTDDSHLIQIESITFGWCDHSRALSHIEDILAGCADDCFSVELKLRLESPEQHGTCSNCR